MCKRITNFAIVAVALLMYPLALSSQNSFSLSLDANSAAGNQAVTSVNASPDQVVAIQIFGRDIQNANGISVRFEYDVGQVGYDSFDAGNVLPNAVVLPAESGTNPTFVQMSLGALGGQATSNTGLVGTIRFRTTAAFSGTRIRLVRGELGRGGQLERVTPNISVELQSGSAALTPDFDGDGMVGFADFLQLAGVFGSSRGDGMYRARYDLDGDGAIGFSDFLIFTNDFGKSVTPSSGGGGGGSSGGTPPTRTPFDLDSNNSNPMGITYANNRFYVVDWDDDYVYAYTSLGQRDSSSDFDLDSHSSPQSITYANNRFYVVDQGDWDRPGDEKVYAYTSLGQRDSSSDFALDGDNSTPSGIMYANNRFYVIDWDDDKVYVYTSGGQRDTASDFVLDGNNSNPVGITYANNRFYVIDREDDYVYAYTSLGQRDSSSDFNLDSNHFPEGITYANNRFYVIDDRYGLDDKVYVYMSPEYSGGGGGRPDLVVESPLVITSSPGPNPGESFTLGVTVHNQGNGPSAATTLRYYRSSNATISTNDTEVGTDSVSGLSASDTSDESISLNAPSSAGTYYYGACVDNVSGESDTGNNCSRGIPVTVQAAGDDHSNTRSGATNLVNSRSGVIETGSDVDYFRVQVSEYGVLTVYTTGDLDTYGTLQNSSGTTLETDDDGGDGYNFGIAYIVNAGTYYIKVEGAYFAATGSYTIHATFDRDDSNTRSGATIFSLDTLSSGSLGNTRLGWIENSSDVDYFRVQLNRSGVLTVYTTGNLDTYGTLQNSSGTTLETDDDGGDNSNFAIQRVVNSGTYYIKVEGYSSSDIGRYFLNVLLE